MKNLLTIVILMLNFSCSQENRVISSHSGVKSKLIDKGALEFFVVTHIIIFLL
jgi:hypothetical protein